MNWLAIIAIGAAVGYLGGLFGKGGSAIATPLLAAVGVPPLAAVASPLPATIPGTLIAYRRYRSAGIGDARTVRLSIAWGVPATIAGAVATHWVGGEALVVVTEAVVAAIGARILLGAGRMVDPVLADPRPAAARVAVTAVLVGFLAGFLANAGGFLLVPLYLAVLRLPVKTALASSLAVAAALAVPGTFVHAALGHVDWAVTVAFGAASIPLSALGARTALRIDSGTLERLYGAALVLLGGGLLVLRLV